MKAKIEPRINLNNRTKLEEVIPLEIPMILFIDPSSICNFKCKICPTGYQDLIRNTKRFQGLMNFEIFKKIIDDLNEFNEPLKVLRLYKEGEPLLNREFPKIVQYAKESNVVDYIDTTTNGYLLTEEFSKEIISAGLDRINISLYGVSSEQYYKVTKTKVSFAKLVENIKYLYENRSNHEKPYICIKTIGNFLTEKDKTKFFNTFEDYADRLFIENVAPCWSEFDIEQKTKIEISKTKGIYNQPLTNVNVCPYIFYSTTINSDGSVSLCFLDWAHKMIIGDIKKQSLKEIWNGNMLYQHQVQHLSGNRKQNPICRNCGQLTHCMPDNIDKYSDIILNKLIERKKEHT